MNIKFALIVAFLATFCIFEVHSKGKIYEDVDDLLQKQAAAHHSDTIHPTPTSIIE
jgi:hypothetical protein